MESPESLFDAGKFADCSRALEMLLNSVNSASEDGKFLCHYKHNKIVADALSHNWFDEEGDVNDMRQVWCNTFMKLTSLCNELRCNLSVLHSGKEVLSVAILNLLSWSWENLGDHFDGYFDQLNRLTVYSLQTELSSCGESVLNPESALDAIELFQQVIWRTSPQQCLVLLDTISLYFLHMLQFESCHQKLTHISKILQGFCEILPQIYIHLTSKTSAGTSPPLFLLGPNIASSKKDPNLTVNFVVSVAVIYLLKLNKADKAWHLLEENSCAKNKTLFVMLEYLKALVCLRRNELDRALYHVNVLSSLPMEAHMIKRKNILIGYLYIRKGNLEEALKRLRDTSGLREDEEQLLILVYLMAQAYGLSSQREQQLVLLDSAAEVLRDDPRYCYLRVTPISSLQDRLLRCVHQQPELNLCQTLVALAEVLMKTSQPEKASECLLEALRQMKCCPSSTSKTCEFVNIRSFQSVMKDAVVSLLKCGDFAKARILCDGLMESPSQDNSPLNDAITRLLVSDALPFSQSEKKQSILLEAIKLLKKQKEQCSKEETGSSKTSLVDSLIARAFYRKAKLYSSNGYNDDASVCFKRALALKEGDEVVMKEYQRHLFMIGNTGDAKNLLEKISGLPTSSQHIQKLFSEGDITMNYLVNEKLEEHSS